MNFYFVDRILECDPGKKTVGLKHVTLNDTYFTASHINPPTLLPSIVGEALGQLCSWNVLQTTDFRFRPVGGVVQEIQMLADAKIGDTIVLESEIETLDTESHLVSFSGRASLNGQTMLIVKNSLAPLLPLEEFNNPEQVKIDFARLYRPRVQTELTQVVTERYNQQAHMVATNRGYQFFYDKIISWEVGQQVVAQKNVSLLAPYFVDHFPRKPVFPLSLLLEYNLQLARHFLIEDEQIAAAPQLQTLMLRKIKIGNFVFPGDSVVTRITVKKCDSSHHMVSLHNEVDGKKVCVAEAEFGLR